MICIQWSRGEDTEDEEAVAETARCGGLWTRSQVELTLLLPFTFELTETAIDPQTHTQTKDRAWQVIITHLTSQKYDK